MREEDARDQKPGPAEHIRAARAGVSGIMRQLSVPTPEGEELLGEMLGDVGRQLQSAAKLLEADGPRHATLRRDVQQLHREIKILSLTLGESDHMISGWVRRLGVKSGGYTEQGASAPLVLVRKVNVSV